MPESHKAERRRAQKVNRDNGIGDENGRIVRVKDPVRMGKCTVCNLEVRMTKTNTELRTHAESKHGSTMEACFGADVAAAEAEAAAAAAAAAAPAGKKAGGGGGGGGKKGGGGDLSALLAAGLAGGAAAAGGADAVPAATAAMRNGAFGECVMVAAV
ncbi:hypothetical protein JKP88DRAFT_354618 [Tribonema minus]|uniref:Uncharacterized protein n=1 Tax=Tribonema minus TaxID=303371 RepID=A0A835Z6U4_9STRA|nr:hypothetical protein JKP88DRAFT_354618 [Tribonema minus]